MKLKISELFEPGDEITVSGEGFPISSEEIKEMTMQKIHAARGRRQVHILRRTGRGLLIAAVLVCLMTATAVAAGLSIHQRRQEELRQELNIEQSAVDNYVEFSVPQETELPEGPSAATLSTFYDGRHQVVYLDISPISAREITQLRALLEGRIGSRRGPSLRAESIGGEKGVYLDIRPFYLGSGVPLYDAETATLTCRLLVPSESLPAEESLTVRLSLLDANETPVRDFGEITIERTEDVCRRVTFDEPLVFSNPLSGEEGRLTGIELHNASFVWLVEIPQQALHSIFDYSPDRDASRQQAREDAFRGWLTPLMDGKLMDGGVTLSDGRWFGGPWVEGEEPWILCYEDENLLKIGYGSIRPVMNPENAVSTTVLGQTISLD